MSQAGAQSRIDRRAQTPKHTFRWMNAHLMKIFANNFLANLFAILLKKWSTRRFHSCSFSCDEEKVSIVMTEMERTKIVTIYNSWICCLCIIYVCVLKPNEPCDCCYGSQTFLFSRPIDWHSMEFCLHHSISIKFTNWSIKLFTLR